MNIPGINAISCKNKGRTSLTPLRVVSVILACLAITACSGTPTKADRDTTGKYDGTWTGQVQTAQSPQFRHNWQLQCSDYAGEMPIRIANGEVSVNLDGNTYTSYITAAGKFNILVKAGKASASASSDVSLSNPNVRVSIQGNLGRDPARGKFVIGLAELGFAGCTSRIEYRKE